MKAKQKKTASRNKANPIDVYVGGRVRHYRQLRSITKAELAKKLNVPLRKINQYESGSTRMGPSTIVKICNALSCHIFDMFEQYVENEDEPIKGAERQRILDVVRCYKEMNS